MKSKIVLPVLALALATLSCNLPLNTPVPGATEIPVTPPAPPTFAVPSDTPLPSETPLPDPTPTPTVPIAFPKDLPVNCRYGPGTVWETVSGLLAGSTAEIVGKNADLSWWYIRDPLVAGDFCWVAMSVTDTAGNIANVPIVPAPEALVTQVTADAGVEFSACGGPNPITFSGSIATNGPAVVEYHWEVTGDKQNVTADENLVFSQAGTKKVTAGAYSADCGSYTIFLRVTEPNERFGRKDFEIKAP